MRLCRLHINICTIWMQFYDFLLTTNFQWNNAVNYDSVYRCDIAFIVSIPLFYGNILVIILVYDTKNWSKKQNYMITRYLYHADFSVQACQQIKARTNIYEYIWRQPSFLSNGSCQLLMIVLSSLSSILNNITKLHMYIKYTWNISIVQMDFSQLLSFAIPELTIFLNFCWQGK